MAFRFERQGRRPRVALVIALYWVGLAVLWLGLDAAPWILALLGLFTVPATLDFATDRRDWIEITPGLLRWGSGRQEVDVAAGRIAHVRLERRFDMTMRARVTLDSGKRMTIPQACLPRSEILESALRDAGYSVQHHPFSLL
ncbi:hypothetical protein [Cognatishimia sp. F0-27]|uniref:hypothetical protein n=1 Tax=Cognatishimia sp. F0-27 TaxID=2816855 RepID=UPI001D0CCE3A|nr:hypothetical protein [Cognatishimia sp. F0-27]MCC1491587.1 hypothetical protein [Cognatishimia sp. F0-27]